MDDSSISLRLLNSLSLPKSVRPHQISVNSDYCAIPLTYEQSELIAILQLPDVFNVTSVASILEHAKVILRSHKSPVLLTKFSHRINNSVLLASASKNEILIWDLSKWSKSQRSWEHVKVIASDVGRCQYLSFLGTSFLAAAVDNICYIFDLKSDKTIKLEGHDGRVTAAEFFPSAGDRERRWLLSISEDRTFKIWDIHERRCIQQSHIISPHPFTTLSFVPDRDRVVLGSDDGSVRWYDFTSIATKMPVEYRCIKSINLNETFPSDHLHPAIDADNNAELEIVSCRPIWKRDQCNFDMKSSKIDSADINISNTIISLHHFAPLSSKSDIPPLIAITPRKLFVLNSNTFEIIHVADFVDEPIENVAANSDFSNSKTCLDVTGSSTFFDGMSSNIGYCLLGSSFHGIISVVEIHKLSSTSEKCLAHDLGELVSFDDAVNLDTLLSDILEKLLQQKLGTNWARNVYGVCLKEITEHKLFKISDLMDFDLERLSPFIPTFIKMTFRNLILRFSPSFEDQIITIEPLRPEEILPGSPLQSSFSQKPLQHLKPSSSRRIYQSSSKSLNKPVTFKSTVKSSGYAQAPRTTKFLGVSQPSCKLKRPSSSQSSTSQIRYPSLNLQLISDTNATRLNGAITHIKFNHSGRYLGVASADKVARCLQYHKNSFGPPKPFSGHGNIINHFDWGTASSNYFLSSSVDVVKLWSLDKSEPLLVMNLIDGNFKSSKCLPKSNIEFIQQKKLTSICESKFYYRDKFILISNANSILMYKYHIDNPSLSKSSLSHSIKPNVNTNVYKLVTSFRVPSQCINSFTNLNTTLSPIIISASSDKSIQVWDVNQNQLITEKKNTHDRQIHWISCSENSGYDGTEISGAGFGNRNLFVTVAAADGIKLWDVRSVSCVKRFEGHMNRYASVKAELSPCGRYIATGSEDNQAYIFDVRTGSLFSKVSSPNHNNIVTCVSWHPVLPVLATAGADGNVAICRHI